MLLLFGLFLVGCWLAMIEFGASFHETSSDRISRAIAWVFIVGLLAAFLINTIVFLRKNRVVKSTSSNSNTDLIGTPWDQNPEFTFDIDQRLEDPKIGNKQDTR